MGRARSVFGLPRLFWVNYPRFPSVEPPQSPLDPLDLANDLGKLETNGIAGRTIGLMIDFFAVDLVEAFEDSGCPLCLVLAEVERHDMVVFIREGRRVPETRARFVASGGFCRRHGWLAVQIADERQERFALVDVYSQVVGHELAAARTSGLLAASSLLARRAACPACQAAQGALSRKAGFLADALRTPSIRAGYVRSDGLCASHLAAVVAEVGSTDAELRTFLLDDWLRRLGRLADDLEEFDRKRDHRYAHEPRGLEQDAWFRAVERFAGQQQFGRPPGRL